MRIRCIGGVAPGWLEDWNGDRSFYRHNKRLDDDHYIGGPEIPKVCTQTYSVYTVRTLFLRDKHSSRPQPVLFAADQSLSDYDAMRELLGDARS